MTVTHTGKDAIANLKTCEVDGQMYKEGQSFEPASTRKTCICTSQWNGTYDDTYCTDINCGLEIHYQDAIFDNCAPVFIGNLKSCPIAFQCRKWYSINLIAKFSSNFKFYCWKLFEYDLLMLNLKVILTIISKCHLCKII